MEIRTKEPMARHTSFRVGGPADRFMIPESEGELREAVLDCKAFGKPWYMVGNGSNLLVGDKGFRGTIISTERLAELEVQKNENSIIAGAGVMLSKLANTAEREAYRSGICGGHSRDRRRRSHDERGCIWFRDEERALVGGRDGPVRDGKAAEE